MLHCEGIKRAQMEQGSPSHKNIAVARRDEGLRRANVLAKCADDQSCHHCS